VIEALAITIPVESLVVAGYAMWRKKPRLHLQVSSLCVNLFTQLFLWGGLLIFQQHYLLTLSILEFCIWGFEAAVLHLYRYNRLNLREALLLSLMMNLTSFGIGWFLPV
jgi:hypothetical protein